MPCFGTPLLYFCILKETYKMQEYGKRNHFTHRTEKAWDGVPGFTTFDDGTSDEIVMSKVAELIDRVLKM